MSVQAAPFAASLLALLGLLGGCSREAPFVRDGETWRYRGHTLDVDAATFRPLGAHYARDATQALHVDTVREAREYWATARLRVRRLQGADLASFEVLDDDHARDRQRVWYDGEVVPAAHAPTFAVLEDGFARDRRRGYWLRVPVPGSDGATFAALGSSHAKDARRVWHCEMTYGDNLVRPRCTTIAGADPATFALPSDPR